MAKVTPLKLAIVASGRTATDVAREAGIHPTHLSRIANGLHADDAMQTAIATALGMQTADLWPEDVAA